MNSRFFSICLQKMRNFKGKEKNLRKVLVVWKKVCTFATANRKTRVCNTKKDALVAQLVEHLTLNQRVQGSNPCRRTKRETHQGFLSFFLSDFTRMGFWSSRSRGLFRRPRITRIHTDFFVTQISQIAQIFLDEHELSEQREQRHKLAWCLCRVVTIMGEANFTNLTNTSILQFYFDHG